MTKPMTSDSEAQSEAPGVKDWLLELLIDYSGMDFCEANDCMSWQSCKEFMGHVEAKINRLIVDKQLDMAKMYAAMGRDDFTWGSGGVPKEVLKVFPNYAPSTADIPRGKKQFMDFVESELSNNLSKGDKK